MNAVIGAAEALRDDIKKLAAFALQASEDEIELFNGGAGIPGDEERWLPFIAFAGMVYWNNAVLPDELASQVSLVRRHVYVAPFEVPDTEKKYGNLTLTYATQTHAAVVEVDEETGKVEILKYAAVDDCGTRFNPMIVEGQVHGAAAHGLGAALREIMDYDEDGQLRTSNFLFYHPPTAVDLPDIETDHIVSPSPFSGTGAKGMGEGGGAPLHTICAAIQDALGPNAPLVWDSHNPPERVFRLLQGQGHGEGRGLSIVSKSD